MEGACIIFTSGRFYKHLLAAGDTILPVMKRCFHIMIGVAALVGLGLDEVNGAEAKLRALILSGANNHDWKTTTPAIKAALEESGRFDVDVENQVMDMKPESFAPYAVIVSNFNTFGGDAPVKKQWDAATKKGFLDHMAQGRGLVIVHAGSSVFYDWPEFHNLACGTWKDGTSHGAIHLNRVTFSDTESPITRGLEPFWIRDEFWQNIAVAPGAKALASVTPDPASKGSGKPENILFTTESGGGRGFALFLGHDAAVMGNSAWRTLLQRGTEWAASGKVTIPPAKNWPSVRGGADGPALSWKHTDTSLALCNGDRTVWRLVFDARQPKSYFHPLATVDGEVLTEFEPADHPWHRGLWWSWKFINGLNYWEENPKTGESQGVNELTRATVEPGDDFTSRAELSFSYHPPGQAAVMTEIRKLAITKPDDGGSYRIDWNSKFTAGDAPVTLARTPLAHEENGKPYGGYAGLSLRLPLRPDGWSVLTSEGKNTATASHGQPARWLDFSFPGGGIAIIDHPGNPRHPTPWYVHDRSPMSFYSPAVLFNQPLVLAAGQSLTFNYRILIHSKPVPTNEIENDFRNFIKP
jgi:type 1 glutamine amidotransferase